MKNIYFLFLLFIGFNASAQPYNINGVVVDANSNQPMPYVSVVAKSTADSSIIVGTTTSKTGDFSLNLQRDNFYVELSFIGYTTKTFKPNTSASSTLNMGIIKLKEASESLQEVEVRAERSTTEFKLDKKVFNVGQDLSSQGLGALEVLNNVPSVSVDIEGQVSLRGNGGVQILINGKPSVLTDEGSNALGSITADMIESIEVITNPSAKYEAEGTAGIINIILKKQEKKGLNGSISANTGIPANHSIGVSLNGRTDDFNLFTQLGAGYRSLPTFSKNENQNKRTGTSIFSDGLEFRNERFANITLGTDYYINKLNVITLSGSFAYEWESQPSETNFIEDQNGVLVSRWQRTETTSATNPKYQYDLQYAKQFANNEDHTLMMSAIGSFFGKDLSSDFTNTTIEGANRDLQQRTETNFQQANYTFKADYTNPISKVFTLEAGSQYDINNVGNNFAVFNIEDGVPVPDNNLTNDFTWQQRVLGVYTTGGYEGKKWGLKLGLRVENTDLYTLLATTGEENNRNFTNYFPSAHTSYKINKRYQLQAGYSRRIFRPRLWDLNPFFNITNNFNIRMGNPNLQPEFSDSYELGGVFIFEKGSLSSSIYHLYTSQLVERVSVFENNVNITMPDNIGTRNRTGLELNGKYNPAKWLTLTGDFNYGYFIRKGQFQDQNFDFTGNQWSTRLATKFKLPKDFDLEFNGNYESSFRTVQGNVSGFAFLDAGLRKKFLKGKVVLNFSVRDVFASRIRESVVNQPNFYAYSFGQRGTFYTLGVSYGFGKGEAMTYSGRRR